MSVTLRTPKNTNFLSRNRFKLVFPRAPSLEYFVNKVVLPSIESPPVPQPTPFTTRFVTGVNTVFEPVEMNILCDEDMTAWQEIHDWVVGASMPRSFEEYADISRRGRLYTDIVVMLMSNGNVPTFQFTFRDAFPYHLGSIDMETSDDGSENITFPVLFKYTDYTIHRHKHP